MATQKQIIAFVNPQTFASLLGDTKPENYVSDNGYLNNGNYLVYVQTDGKCKVDAYDEEKAKAAAIILVADTFDFQYVPEVPFKVLFHTQTDVTSRVQRLRDITNHFQGDEKSQEENNTPYQKIADLIKEKEGVAFEGIYEEIKDFDPEEENFNEDIFNAIYEQKEEDAIGTAVNKRDKHIKGKGKN